MKVDLYIADGCKKISLKKSPITYLMPSSCGATIPEETKDLICLGFEKSKKTFCFAKGVQKVIFSANFLPSWLHATSSKTIY